MCMVAWLPTRLRGCVVCGVRDRGVSGVRGFVVWCVAAWLRGVICVVRGAWCVVCVVCVAACVVCVDCVVLCVTAWCVWCA
jgi:hypothetical protein